MCSADEIHIMVIQEGRNYIPSKHETYTSFILTPSGHTLLRISPKQVTQKAGIGHFNRPHNLQNLLEALKLGTEPSMHAHYFFIDQGTYWHHVEYISKNLPQL